MPRLSSAASVLALSVAALLWTSSVRADAKGSEVLQAMDRAVNAASTLELLYDLINEVPGKAARTMKLEVKTKGEMRFTEFLAPGDMKGTRVLSLSRTRMYVYLPAYDKVRRIASHATEQGFLGSAFSQDDMATTHYDPLYDGTLLSEDAASWTVRGVRRPDVQAHYASAVFVVRKDGNVPLEIRYFGADGQHLKTETRGDYATQGSVVNPGLIVMVDHSRGGAKSTLKRLSWTADPDIPDRVFSVRSLQRAR